MMRSIIRCTPPLCTMLLCMSTTAFGICDLPSFRSPRTFPAGVAPSKVATGDFNLDGKPDLAIANQASSNISVFLGDGIGGFAGPTNLPVGSIPSQVRTADVNRDGKADLLVAAFGTDQIAVLIGNGAGSFAAPILVATGNQPTDVASGDYNGDGIPDLAVVRLSGTSLTLHIGVGNGTFGTGTALSLSPHFGARSIVTADFNRDGDLDLVASGSTSGNVGGIFVLLGNGSGTFGSATHFPTAGTTGPEGITAADLNHDGQLDVAAANRGGFAASVLLGNGNGGFGTATNIALTSPADVVAQDFNGDGKVDLGLAKDGGPTVLLGNGTGAFTPGLNISGGGGFGIAVGDFNLDGKPDMATSGTATDNFAIRLSSCGGLTTKPVPDFTGDGIADLSFFRPSNGFWFVLRSEDFSFFSFPFGLNGDVPVAGDYDGDGKTDAAVFRPSTRTWFLQLSAGGTTITQFGLSSDNPTPADYDGDGRTDIAIQRPTNGEWWIMRSNTNSVIAAQFGAPGDIPIE